MFVPKYLVNCNAYQPSFQFPLCFSYEDVVEKDDVSRTVKEVVEEVNIFKYIDFSQYNAHGYDAIQMFEAVTDIYDMYMYQVTSMILEHIFHLWKAIIWLMEAIHMPHQQMQDTEVLTTINMTRNMEFNCI